MGDILKSNFDFKLFGRLHLNNLESVVNYDRICTVQMMVNSEIFEANMEVISSEDYLQAVRRILQVFHSEDGTFENEELQRLVFAVELFQLKNQMGTSDYDKK